MSLSLSELKEKTPTELAEVARSLKLDNVTRLRKQDQIFAILKSQAKRGEKIKGAGAGATAAPAPAPVDVDFDDGDEAGF